MLFPLCSIQTSLTLCSVLLPLDVVDEAAGLGNVLHEARKRVRMEDVARRQVLDRAGRRVDAQLIAGLDLLDILADLQKRQADVDAIAVKDAREARGDDDRDCLLYTSRCV